MSMIKNVVIEAMATHPGFLKLKLVNSDGTLACETIMSIGMANQVAKDVEENTKIAVDLLSNLQTLITKESLNGSFGKEMQTWAEKGGYEYNKKLEMEANNA